MRIANEDYLALLESLLSSGNAVTTRGKGASMYPTIPDGSRLSVIPLRPEDIRPGDVVFLKSSGGYPLFHRVARRYSVRGTQYVQTWGDACPSPDAAVSLDNILGRVESVTVDGISTDLSSTRRRYAWRFRVRRVKRFVKRILGRADKAPRPTPCSPAE